MFGVGKGQARELCFGTCWSCAAVEEIFIAIFNAAVKRNIIKNK